VSKRDAKVGGEVGCIANLALGPEDLPGDRGGTGNDVENGLLVRAAEPDQEEPVVDRLAEPRPLEVKQRRHALIAREPVAPVAVRVHRDDRLCGQRRALRDRHQAVEQRAAHDSVPVRGREVLDLGQERSLADEAAVVKRFSQRLFGVARGYPAV
jgi:hypothetical protein